MRRLLGLSLGLFARFFLRIHHAIGQALTPAGIALTLRRNFALMDSFLIDSFHNDTNGAPKLAPKACSPDRTIPPK
jgi:hypothetical protein